MNTSLLSFDLPEIIHRKLAYLPENQSKVANGILNCPLELLKMPTSMLDAGECNEKTQNVIRAFKDSEDPQVSHHFLQAQCFHVTISAKDLQSTIKPIQLCFFRQAYLNSFISDEPGSFRGEYFRYSSLKLGTKCKSFRDDVSAWYSL